MNGDIYIKKYYIAQGKNIAVAAGYKISRALACTAVNLQESVLYITLFTFLFQRSSLVPLKRNDLQRT